ncbi:MAG: hypothetical protein ACI4E1_03970 [Lachnospira sp.]
MRMERNKEIGTSESLAKSLTEEQCDVLEWASNMRHIMHKNSGSLYDVNAPNHKELKAFISDTYHSQNSNNLNKRLRDVGLPPIKWSFVDTEIPTNEIALLLDNRKLDKSRKRRCLKILEQANADIENYFSTIDEKYLTFYCPTGSKRIYNTYARQTVSDSRSATISEGYVVAGIDKVKSNIAAMLQVYVDQISIEDIIEYVNKDINSRIYHMDSSMAPKSVEDATNALIETGYVKPSTQERIYISLTKKGDKFVGNFCGTLIRIAGTLSVLPINKVHKNDIVYYSHLLEQKAAKKPIKPLMPKSVDFITNELKEKHDTMFLREELSPVIMDYCTHCIDVNKLPVIYEAKQNTYIVAEVTTLSGKVNVSIINSLFVGTAFTITIQQYEFVTLYYPGDEIELGQIPQEVQKQLKAVIPKLISIIT